MQDDGSRKRDQGGRPSPKAQPQGAPRPANSPKAPASPPPRTQTAPSMPRAPVVPPPRTQSSVSTPRAAVVPPARTQSSAALPRTVTQPGSLLARQLGGVENHQQAQKELLQSAFAQDDEVTQFDSLLGARRTAPEADDEPTSLGQTFDGETPAPEVTSRDLFKAISAPLQSREGRRSGPLYEQILNQFAAGKNPRYDPDGPEKPRAHIFVWDVTRAMGAEIPHFVGPRELSLGLTVDWLRHEGTMRGWRRCSDEEALAFANKGQPVVAVPKEIRTKGMALVRPGKLNFDGNPFMCGAGSRRGNKLSLNEALGVFAAEFFVHA